MKQVFRLCNNYEEVLKFVKDVKELTGQDFRYDWVKDMKPNWFPKYMSAAHYDRSIGHMPIKQAHLCGKRWYEDNGFKEFPPMVEEPVKTKTPESRNAVFAMIHNDSHVFMIFRADGKVGLPGGKVENGENFLQALSREVKEEVGFSFQSESLLKSSQYDGIKINRKMTSHVFSLKVDSSVLGTLSALVSRKAGSHSQEVVGSMVVEIDKTKFSEMNLAPTLLEELKQVFGDRIK